MTINFFFNFNFFYQFLNDKFRDASSNKQRVNVEKSLLFNRFVHVFDFLYKNICFRCAKRTNENVFNVYKKIFNVKCEYCKKTKKICLKIVIFSVMKIFKLILTNFFVCRLRFKSFFCLSRNDDDLL